MRMRNALWLLVFLAAPVCAQQARLDERLPASTTFYVYWRGAASYEPVKNTNPLLLMWNDPEFAPARAELLDQIARNFSKTPVPAALTREMVLALLENPFVVGAVSTGKPAETKLLAKNGAEKPAVPDNTFLLYDATEKKQLLEKILSLEFAGAGSPPAITRSAFGKTSIEAVAAEKETYYRAFVGNFFIRAAQKAILEDLIGRLETATPPAANLTTLAEYQDARRVIGEQASLEFLLRIPDLTKAGLPGTSGVNADAVMKPLGVEKLRAVCGGLTFTAEATRARGAVLGDTSPGGLFDLLAGESTSNFATMAAAPAGTASFTAFRLDLPAIYKLVRSVVNAVMPSQQGNPADALEGMAATGLGMSIPDALGLFSGEFATYSTDLGIDPYSNYYAVGIHKPQQVLSLLRTFLRDKILSEDGAGQNTVLSVTTSFADLKTGAPRKRFYYLGVTPQLLLVSPRKTALRETLQRLAAPAGSSAAILAADAKFAAARGRIPQSLSGISYFDLSRVRWEAELESAGPATADPPKSGAAATPAAASSAAPDWRKLVSPAVLSRYLHLAVSGWWKGPDCLHFDGFIE